MRILALLVAALAATALSGCLSGTGTVTAKGLLGDATDAARDWVDAPVLVEVLSLEPFRHIAEEDFEMQVHLDSSPGDGKAPGWVYVFDGAVDGQGRTVFIAIAEGLGVLAEGWQSYGEDDDFPITDQAIVGWTLDSDDVADILDDEEWPAPADNATYAWELRMWDDGPVWTVARSDPDSYYEAFVHATNGTVMDIEWGDDFGSCSFGESWGSTTVTPLGGGSAQTDLDRPGHVSAHASVSPTAGAILVTLTGPEGVLASQSFSSADQFVYESDDAAAGDYVLEVSADGVGLGAVDYELMTSSC